MKTVKDGRFPVKVTEGGVSAKIRKITQCKNGRPYVIYLADYVLLGKRKQVGRSTFEEAKQVALNACRQIASGQHLSLTLTNEDRMTYLRATEALAPMGVKLDAAILEYIAAVKNLPKGASLNEAVEFYRRRNPLALEKRTVRQVTDNLAQWLMPYAKDCGSIIQGACWEQIPPLVEAVNRKRLNAKAAFAWKHNALRHSFCSYRLVAIKNTAQVALEAGNSPKIIFKHYRQLVTESDAAKWFGIAPETPGNVIRLSEPKQAVA